MTEHSGSSGIPELEFTDLFGDSNLQRGESVRAFVVATLAEQIGPVAEVIVAEALYDSNLTTTELHQSRRFLILLKALKAQLPEDIDRQSTYDQLWHRALECFTFD